VTTRKAVEAYPLSWPEGWPRTELPGFSKFKTATDKARKKLLAEVSLMGGSSTIISSNVPLRTDGQMRADREPVDAGVAVYFQRNEKGMVFACDRYDFVRDNLHALALTIEALRGIERWGASEMMERAFSGFKQLNAENEGDSWWGILQIEPSATIAEIETSYKRLAKFAHPDQPGGSHFAMGALNVARDQALNVARQRKL
jgi:hypothetical protein